MGQGCLQIKQKEEDCINHEHEIVALRVEVNKLKQSLRSSQALENIIDFQRSPFINTGLGYIGETSHSNDGEKPQVYKEQPQEENSHLNDEEQPHEKKPHLNNEEQLQEEKKSFVRKSYPKNEEQPLFKKSYPKNEEKPKVEVL